MGNTLDYAPGCDDQNRIFGFSESTFSAPMPPGPRKVPIMIPRDEVGYWSLRWRQDEAESRAALKAGDYVTFDSDDPTDAARWLLSDD